MRGLVPLQDFAGACSPLNDRPLLRILYLKVFRRRNAMRLANRALIAALAMLMICSAVNAQTRRAEKDPRNQSPSVGTGGPEGGATESPVPQPE